VLGIAPSAWIYGGVVVTLTAFLALCLWRAREARARAALEQVSSGEVQQLLDSLTAQTRHAGDVHDVLAQGFTAIVVQLQAATDARSKGLHTDADGHLEIARRLARENLQEARNSARALRPDAGH
jgi:signal transduction histidine kinase